MDKQTVVQMEYYPSIKKGKYIDKHNMDESQKHCAQ